MGRVVTVVTGEMGTSRGDGVCRLAGEDALGRRRTSNQTKGRTGMGGLGYQSTPTESGSHLARPCCPRG